MRTGDDLDGGPGRVDGRRTRRDRNRDAVVDALLDLLNEGLLSPSVVEIAERSGVSYRSVFRYFEDVDELYEAAIERELERLADLLELDRPGEGTLDERIAALVAHRLRLLDAVGAVARASRRRAPFEPVLADELRRSRIRMRRQVRRQFAPELDALPRQQADEALAVADVLLSLESHDLLRDDQGLSWPATERALTSALRALFAPAAAAAAAAAATPPAATPPATAATTAAPAGTTAATPGATP